MSGRAFFQNGDTSDVEVIISSDRISTQTQEPIVHTGAEQSSLKRELYAYAFQNMWCQAKSIYDRFPDMVRIPLNSSGDTSLHVAVSANSTDFVKKLVNFEHLTPRDLEIPNAEGNTAFCMAAITGGSEFLQIMIEKNEKLPLIPRKDDKMLPVHLATLTCCHEIVQDLTSENLLQRMQLKDIERLLFMAINCSMYDVATKLVEKYPEPLSIVRDDEENLTALHMLVRKPPREFYMQENKKEGSPWELLKKLWAQVRELEYKKRSELITKPSVVLFDAVKSGNIDVLKWLLYMNRELLTIKDPTNGQNLLHFVVSCGQHSIFRFILKMRTANLVLLAVDNNRNNVLHFAARQLQEASSTLRTIPKLGEDYFWLWYVILAVPRELRTMRNKEGTTPEDIYDGCSKNWSKEATKAAQKIASSGMVVGALIATITFAAALTTPGGNDNVNTNLFGLFIMTNAIGLFSSCVSIVCFFFVFTIQRFKKRRFTFLLHAILIDYGQMMLFISNVAMLIAFILSSFLILRHTHFKWVSYGVIAFGVLTILEFIPPRMQILPTFKLLRALYERINVILGDM